MTKTYGRLNLLFRVLSSERPRQALEFSMTAFCRGPCSRGACGRVRLTQPDGGLRSLSRVWTLVGNNWLIIVDSGVEKGVEKGAGLEQSFEANLSRQKGTEVPATAVELMQVAAG